MPNEDGRGPARRPALERLLVSVCTRCVIGNVRVLKIRTGTYLKLVEKTRPRSKKRISRSLRPHIALGCPPDHSTRVLREGEL